MSADNWGKCPVCYKKAKEERANAKTKAKEEYGKVSIDEFQELVHEAVKELNLDDTLREDYVIETNDAGYFHIEYKCECECGFKYEFKEHININASLT